MPMTMPSAPTTAWPPRHRHRGHGDPFGDAHLDTVPGQCRLDLRFCDRRQGLERGLGPTELEVERAGGPGAARPPRAPPARHAGRAGRCPPRRCGRRRAAACGSRRGRRPRAGPHRRASSAGGAGGGPRRAARRRGGRRSADRPRAATRWAPVRQPQAQRGSRPARAAGADLGVGADGRMGGAALKSRPLVEGCRSRWPGRSRPARSRGGGRHRSRRAPGGAPRCMRAKTSSARPPGSAWMKLACLVGDLGACPSAGPWPRRPRPGARRSRRAGLVNTEPALDPPGWLLAPPAHDLGEGGLAGGRIARPRARAVAATTTLVAARFERR